MLPTFSFFRLWSPRLLAFSIIVLLGIAGCKSRQDTPNFPQEELERLRAQEKTLLRANDSLLTVLSKQTPAAPTEMTGSYLVNGSSLARNKVPVAPQALAAYLQENHANLITVDGVLGGTMHFEEAIPLANEFVFASLSDGHIMVYALYRYHAKRDGTLTWKQVYILPPEG